MILFVFPSMMLMKYSAVEKEVPWLFMVGVSLNQLADVAPVC